MKNRIRVIALVVGAVLLIVCAILLNTHVISVDVARVILFGVPVGSLLLGRLLNRKVVQ